MKNYDLKNIDIHSHKEKANVGKYVYHLTKKYNRESIEKYGLNGFKNKNRNPNNCQVFAHNTNRFSKDWYWFWIDVYEYGSTYYEPFIDLEINERDETRLIVNQYYDIWRIDTEITSKNWYIDFFGLNDNPVEQKDYYVKCFNNIEPSVLKLCALDIDIKQEINTKDGIRVTYFNPIIPRDEFILKHGIKPEEEINIEINKRKYSEVTPLNHKDISYWKRLNKNNFSIKNAA